MPVKVVEVTMGTASATQMTIIKGKEFTMKAIVIPIFVTISYC
jgi:hypothetical protein